MLQRILRASVVFALLWVLGAPLGALHPLGDSLAVFVVYAAAVGFLAGLISWRWWLSRAAMALFALILVVRAAVGVDWSPVGEPTFTVYQKNLYYKEADRQPFIEDVFASGADFVTLQELGPANLPVISALSDIYPYHVRCGLGVAILSRWPIVSEPCVGDVGFVEAIADTPQGPVRIIALHLRWPFPLNQASDVEQILAQLAPPSGLPTIVAGDFNMQPWGSSLRRIARATDVSWIGHVERTFEVFGFIPLRIDHVLAGPDARGDVDVRPRLGSDHFGLVAWIAFGDP